MIVLLALAACNEPPPVRTPIAEERLRGGPVDAGAASQVPTDLSGVKLGSGEDAPELKGSSLVGQLSGTKTLRVRATGKQIFGVPLAEEASVTVRSGKVVEIAGALADTAACDKLISAASAALGTPETAFGNSIWSDEKHQLSVSRPIEGAEAPASCAVMVRGAPDLQAPLPAIPTSRPASCGPTIPQASSPLDSIAFASTKSARLAAGECDSLVERFFELSFATTGDPSRDRSTLRARAVARAGAGCNDRAIAIKKGCTDAGTRAHQTCMAAADSLEAYRDCAKDPTGKAPAAAGATSAPVPKAPPPKKGGPKKR